MRRMISGFPAAYLDWHFWRHIHPVVVLIPHALYAEIRAVLSVKHRSCGGLHKHVSSYASPALANEDPAMHPEAMKLVRLGHELQWKMERDKGKGLIGLNTWTWCES